MIESQALGFVARYEYFLFFDDYDDKTYTRARALLLCLFHVASVRLRVKLFCGLFGFCFFFPFVCSFHAENNKRLSSFLAEHTRELA